MSSAGSVLLAPHATTVVMSSPPPLWSSRAVSGVLSWRHEQEFTAHFPFRNAMALVSCSLHMQSTSLEDLQLHFNGDILLTLLPCQQGNVQMGLSTMFLPLENQSWKSSALPPQYTVGLNNNLCCGELGHLAQNPYQFHVWIVLGDYGWIQLVLKHQLNSHKYTTSDAETLAKLQY